MPLVIQRREKAMSDRRDTRLYLVMGIFFLMAALIIARLFFLQILLYDRYFARAQKLHFIEKEIPAPRGEIIVQDNNAVFPIVRNENYFLAYADPREITDNEKFIDEISLALSLSDEEWKELAQRINKKNDPYEPIKKKVTKAEAEDLKKKDIRGLHFISETYRAYPEKGIGGHILGYVDYSGAGKYGLEGYYNEELAGKPGKIRTSKDAGGKALLIGDREVENPVSGKDFILTIDRNIQFKTCEKIKDGVKTFEAKSGTAIVMNPDTGAIIAMCSFPDFDPENYSDTKDINVFNNPAIFYAYEPGSIFKVITMSLGLELKKVSPNTTYEDMGEIRIIGQKPIQNFDKKAHGIQTMTEVLEKSLNTGAVFVESLVGKKDFTKYVKDFGFGEITGTGLDTETAGNISSLDKRGDIFAMTASFGQGITVTPIQFITAFSALVNGGELMRPYIVEKVMEKGVIAQKNHPQVIRRVISENTSALISGMMVSVVEKGWDNKTKIPGYYVGGKTGTAQVAGADGKYGDKTIHSFVGFAPAYSPKVAILIKLDNPQKRAFASETTTVVFRDIVDYILRYYNISPDRK